MASVARTLSDYFEPASRLQVSAKLRHLLRFSDFMLLITGERGSGKTTLLQQIMPQSDDDLRWASLSFDGTVDVTRLLVALCDAFEVDCGTEPDNRARLRALHGFAKSLRDVDVPLLLFIDDADYLTNNALELLINFTLAEDIAPRVVMTGSGEFEQRLHGHALESVLDGRLHVQLLEPFEPDEAEEFLELLLPPGVVVDARKRRALIDEADGFPGRLRAGLVELTRDGGIRRPPLRAFPLPHSQMLGVAAVLLLIIGVSVWFYLPSQPEAVEADKGRVELPLDLPVVAVAPDGTETVIDVRSEIQQRISEQEALQQEPSAPVAVDEAPLPVGEPVASSATEAPAEPPLEQAIAAAVPETTERPAPPPVAEPSTPIAAPAPAAPVAVEPPVAKPPAVKEPAPAVAKAPAAAPAAKSVVASAPKTSDSKVAVAVSRAEELLAWPDTGYTLQVMGARSAERISSFIASQQQPQRFYYFETLYKNAPWHVVVYGQFNDRTAAMTAIEALPLALRKLRPWPRSISGVKADIQKLKQ